MSTYYDVLPQLLHNLLDYIIQHTTYLLSRGLLSSTSRPMYANPSLAPTSRWYCVHALRSDPLDNIHYPFSYQLTSWFCVEVSTTCYSLSACLTLAGTWADILSNTLASLLHPPVLSVNAPSRVWAGLHRWTIAGAVV
jgi:hypothetical protein